MRRKHLHTECAQIVVALGKTETFGKRIFCDDGVGIENDGKGATCLAYGLVVGFGKAHIVVVFHKPYVGKFGFHERHCFVGGMVVDHPNFALSALERFLGRTDGLLQEMLHAKTDYDDRNFQFLDVIS